MEKKESGNKVDTAHIVLHAASYSTLEQQPKRKRKKQRRGQNAVFARSEARRKMPKVVGTVNHAGRPVMQQSAVFARNLWLQMQTAFAPLCQGAGVKSECVRFASSASGNQCVLHVGGHNGTPVAWSVKGCCLRIERTEGGIAQAVSIDFSARTV